MARFFFIPVTAPSAGAVTGDLAATDPLDAFGATATVLVEGDLAATDALDTAALTGSTSGVGVPVAVGSITNRRIQENTGTVSIATAAAFTGETSYALVSPPTGVTIDSGTGVVSVNTATVGRRLNTSITVRASNVAGSADQVFTISVGPQKGISSPSGDLSTLSGAQRTAVFNAIAADGYVYVRIDAWRSNIEGPVGVNDWSLNDDLHTRATAAGLQVTWIALGTPGFTGQAWNDLPSNLTQWANWIGALVARYPDVKVIEIWNEPNGGFAVPNNSGAAYENVLTAAYDRIKSLDSTITVLFAGLTGSDASDGTGAENYLTSAYGAGAGAKFDAFNIHPYIWTVFASGKNWDATDGWMASQVARDCRTIMVSNGDSAKKYWITETGGPTGGTGSVTQAQQSAMLLQAWDAGCSAEPAMGPVFVYSWFDRGGVSTDTENWFGINGVQPGFTAKTARTSLAAIERGTTDVLAQGTLAATDVNDTAALTGKALVQATLAATDANDTAALTGAPSYVGTLAATDVNDTAALTGKALVQATLAATDVNDTAALTGAPSYVGILAATDVNDTAVFSGNVLVQGTLLASDSPDIAAFLAGAFTTTTGTLDASDVVDVAALSGNVLVQGILAAADTGDVAALAGAPSYTSTLAATDASDTGALAGQVLVKGTLAATDAVDTGAFTGAPVHVCTLAATDVPDTTAVTGKVLVKGTLAATDTVDLANFAAGLVASALLAAVDAADTMAASGQVLVQATLAGTDTPDVSAIAGGVVARGTLAATDATDVAALTGVVPPLIQITIAATDIPDVAAFLGKVRVWGNLTATEALDAAVLIGGVSSGAGAPRPKVASMFNFIPIQEPQLNVASLAQVSRQLKEAVEQLQKISRTGKSP